MGKGRMIIGLLFLLLGASILLKVFFKIDIPVFKTGLALFLIYMGFKMLSGVFNFSKSAEVKIDNFTAFESTDFKFERGSDQHKQYSIVFGSSQVDLTQVLSDLSEDQMVEVNTVFGETVVKLNRNTPMVIRANSVFGEARMPNENMVAFGTINYANDQFAKSENKKALRIRGNVVFGSIRFEFID